MPQLDPASFISQLFWLAITFSLLYVMLAKNLLPKITNILQARENLIVSHLTQAEQAKAEASLIETEYKKSIKDARQKAQAILDQAALTIKELEAKKNEELGRLIHAKQEEAEKSFIAQEKMEREQFAQVSKDLANEFVHKLIGAEVSAEQIAQLLANANVKR
jgi:F-type H+-transporting ATPase subunit b